MRTRKTKIAILLSSITLSATSGLALADSDAKQGQQQNDSSITTLSDGILSLPRVTTEHVQLTPLTMTSGKDRPIGYTISFDGVSAANQHNLWPNVKMTPDNGTWNWNAKGSLKLDITNPGIQVAKIILKLSDNLGVIGSAENQLNYAATIAPNTTETVEMLFNGSKRQFDGYWGGNQLNLRQLAEFQIYVQGPIEPQTIIMNNIELTHATGDFIAAEERVINAGPVPTLALISDFTHGEQTGIAQDQSTAIIPPFDKTAKNGKQSITFPATEDYPNLVIQPKQPWDWSELGDFNLAFDIANPIDEAVQLFFRVDQAKNSQQGGTADGVTDSLSGFATLQPNSDSTYYLSLGQSAGAMISGMRSEPPKRSYDAHAISYGWGETALNTSHIHSLQLYLQNPTKDAEIEIGAVRLIPNLDADVTRYQHIIDQYGQFTGDDWPEKILNDEQLQLAGQHALEQLGNATPMADRCLHGGWNKGPKLEATGFFRTEKLDGKWTLVDPQGCLFFMTGLDNVRMDDTVTITGIDYTKGDPNYANIASPLRHSMFEWLPERNDPLAVNYDYAPFVHSGALRQGEVFSFYRANLMRKYGTEKAEAMQIWKDVTLDRMTEWGFTSLGNWIDPMFYGSERIAYQVHGWINGDHKRISTGNDYWGPIHDPFDPEFINSTREMAKVVASHVSIDDPWLIGVFVDNEISWGNVMNEANHYGLIINALSYDSKESPAKTAFSQHLKAKYSSIEKLNQAWQSKIESWSAFESSFEHRSALTQGMRKDYSELLQLLSERYFSIVQAEVKKVLPNHLYLGARFADWGVTPEIARGAAKYVDVMSYNLYANDLNDSKKAHWKNLLPELDKPSVIGEFHFGSTDTGLFHGGIITVADQAERAKMYTHYMESVVNNPYFVGAHWFQYLDSPASGRAWDGENYNIGFVTVADEPYVELIEAAQQFNADLYHKRFEEKTL
ncbi:beta-agarase [Photobacterium gaetbulicola]|uniref:Putative agarase n=1 Tax=Photobacterium gaetbulicola Gung47 TaxID=658445 RepID=A0A0C5WE26_9GAMM|nr:beta-galactosidase [Photobacterium gaetbulicola]AJR05318.1 putative agarase [Photobacterium gaetbulicola Gung47]PSU12645.1 beta-agarase [Photobacterium gaetbulicola]